jgi:hypothetical protein
MRKTAVAVAGGALAVMLSAPAAHAATTVSSTERDQSGTLHHCCHRHSRDRDYRDRDYGDRADRDRPDRDWDDRDDRDDGGWDGWHCHQGVLGRLVDYLLW